MTETALVKYDITDAAIAEIENRYMGLVIVDLEDKEQFDIVHSARMVVKEKRIDVEKTRKGLKADALAWGKKVDTEAKRIFALLEPIETHLDKEEKKVTDEQKRIKAEEDEKERVIIQGRVDELAKYNSMYPFFDVAGWTDGEFDSHLIIAKDDYFDEKEQKRLEEAAHIAEDARLKKVKEEQEAVAKRQAEAQKKIDDANAKIEADNSKLEELKRKLVEQRRLSREQSLRGIDIFRAGMAGESLVSKFEDFVYSGPHLTWNFVVDLSDEDFSELLKDLKEQTHKFEIDAKKEAGIQAEKVAKEKIEREAKEKTEAEEKTKAEAERKLALRPDREKLIAWIDWFLDTGNLPIRPKLQAEEAQTILYDALHAMNSWLGDIRNRAEEM